MSFSRTPVMIRSAQFLPAGRMANMETTRMSEARRQIHSCTGNKQEDRLECVYDLLSQCSVEERELVRDRLSQLEVIIDARLIRAPIIDESILGYGFR